MLFLAGLMGVLAVGATALVGLEVASDPDEERDEDALDQALSAQDAESSGDDLISIATAGFDAVSPATDTPEHADHIISDYPASPNESESEVDFFAEQYGAVFSGLDMESAAAEQVIDGPADGMAEATPDDVLAQMHQDEVTDFSADDDRLVVIFDDQVDPNPQVGLEEDESETARTHLTLNGTRIAAVDAAEGLTLDHITLVPQSTVENAAAA